MRKIKFKVSRKWKKHKYSLGYSNGDTPPVLANEGRPKLLGWFLVISAVVLDTIIMVVIAPMLIGEELTGALFILVPLNGLAILQIIGGIRLIRNGSRFESYPGLKRKFIRICCFVILFASLFFTINTLFLKKESTIIVRNPSQTDFLVKNLTFYIIVNESLTLHCDVSDYEYVRDDKTYGENSAFEIQYKWNLLDPHYGRIIKINKLD